VGQVESLSNSRLTLLTFPMEPFAALKWMQRSATAPAWSDNVGVLANPTAAE